MNPYVVFLLYLLAILSFVAITLTLNGVLGPKPVSSALKMEPFECGATPVSTLNVKAVPIKYYAVAIVFILFDLETVFLFVLALGAQPLTGFMLFTFLLFDLETVFLFVWALGAQPLTGFMVLTFFLFASLLVLILLYVYKQRLLEAVTD